MKHLKLIFLLTLIVFTACRKDPDHRTEPGDNSSSYVQPDEEKALVSAANAGVEINSCEQTGEGVVVVFAEPYSLKGKEYRRMVIAGKYVKSVSEVYGGVLLVFVDNVSVKLYYQKEVSVNLDQLTACKGYPAERHEIPFEILKLGRGKLSAIVKGKDGFEPVISFDETTRTGTLSFSFSDTPATELRAEIYITDGSATSIYVLSATSYYFSVDVSTDNIILQGKADSTAEVSYEVNTDVPECVVDVSTSGGFFSYSGNTVAANSENNSGMVREGSISIDEHSGYFPTCSIKVVQARNDVVYFADECLKNILLSIADYDKDGEVSFDEALTVKEINAIGKGIKNVAGLEWFKNVWKVDLQNNDIQDASCFKELPLLHWLDLKGNKNLRTFDVTGCSQYFDHCEFEVTDNLKYYTFRQQIGVTNYSDPNCEHSVHLLDGRESSDWSHHKVWHKVREHTKATEQYPDGISIVFSGVGYIDVDLLDGSFQRLMEDSIEAYFSGDEYLNAYRDYFDIYYVEYMQTDRNYNCYTWEDAKGWTPSELGEVHPIRFKMWEDIDAVQRCCYEALYGDTTWALDYGPTKQYPPQLVVLVCCNPISFILYMGDRASMPNDTISYFDYRQCQYTDTFSTHMGASTGSEADTDESLYRNHPEWKDLKEQLGYNIGMGEAFLEFCGILP